MSGNKKAMLLTEYCEVKMSMESLILAQDER